MAGRVSVRTLGVRLAAALLLSLCAGLLTLSPVAFAQEPDPAIEAGRAALGGVLRTVRRYVEPYQARERYAAFAEGGADSPDADAQLAAMVESDASVLAARIVREPRPALAPDASPPFNFAALDIARRAADEGDTPPAEMHFTGTPDEHMAIAVRPGAEPGWPVVWLALDAAPVRAAIAGAGVNGYVDFRQAVGDERAVTLARSGDPAVSLEGPNAFEMALKSTAISARFWPPPPEPGLLDVAGRWLPYVGGAVLAVVLAGAGLALRRRRAPKQAAPSKPPASVARPSNERYLEEALAESARNPAPPPDERSVITQVETVLEEVPGAMPSASQQATVSDADSLAPANIFRAYDVRGVVADALTPDTVRAIGRAIGSEAADLGQQTVVVARDGRLSGPDLKSALTEGLLSTGRDVVDIGAVPTPLLYFATHYLRTGTGVMVTGSHNPPEYNGLKTMVAGETLFGDRIQALRQRILDDNFTDAAPGRTSEVDILEDYVRAVSEDIPVAFGRSFKVVVDCGNGIAGVIAPKLFRAIGHDVVELYCEVDGNFPNHHPDPSVPANLADLVSAVAAEGADLGFAFDGDGDRLGVVDAKGNVIFPDRQMIMFARDVLKQKPGSEIVFDVKCSSRLIEAIEEAGGKPVMWKTGHSFIKGKLKESGAPLAGEMSGHIFFNDRWFGFDDALYAGARMLEMLTDIEGSPSDLFSSIPDGVSTPELKVEMEEGASAPFMQALLDSEAFSDGRVTTIDGLRVDYDDCWGLARASNTTPSLVLRFEGNDSDALERIKGRFRDAMLSVDGALVLPI